MRSHSEGNATTLSRGSNFSRGSSSMGTSWAGYRHRVDKIFDDSCVDSVLSLKSSTLSPRFGPTISEKESGLTLWSCCDASCNSHRVIIACPMRISAPGDCNHALRHSSGALAVRIGPTTSGSGDGRSATNSDDDGDGDNNRSDDGDGDNIRSKPSTENRSR
jgi:hypothetical protein